MMLSKIGEVALKVLLYRSGDVFEQAHRSFSSRRKFMAIGVVAVAVMASSYDVYGCQSSASDLGDPAPQIETTCTGTEACAAGDKLRKKPYVKNDFWWGMYVPFTHILAQKVYTHEDYVSWGVNLTKKSIRWINKYAGGDRGGRCLMSVGSCKVDYGFWQTETCDRDGPDTCLFRHENQGEANLVYNGFVFNRYMRSCLGTRISWNLYDGKGGHSRNAWEGSCAGGYPGLAAAMIAADQSLDQTLTVGDGTNQVALSKYISHGSVVKLNDACFRRGAKSECLREASSVYQQLPLKVRRMVPERVREEVKANG